MVVKIALNSIMLITQEQITTNHNELLGAEEMLRFLFSIQTYTSHLSGNSGFEMTVDDLTKRGFDTEITLEMPTAPYMFFIPYPTTAESYRNLLKTAYIVVDHWLKSSYGVNWNPEIDQDTYINNEVNHEFLHATTAADIIASKEDQNSYGVYLGVGIELTFNEDHLNVAIVPLMQLTGKFTLAEFCRVIMAPHYGNRLSKGDQQKIELFESRVMKYSRRHTDVAFSDEIRGVLKEYNYPLQPIGRAQAFLRAFGRLIINLENLEERLSQNLNTLK
jgi:hypothetical protein